MKQTISHTTITKNDDDWKEFGTLLKMLEGKDKSERVRELVERDIKRLRKKLSEKDTEEDKLYKLMHRR